MNEKNNDQNEDFDKSQNENLNPEENPQESTSPESPEESTENTPEEDFPETPPKEPIIEEDLPEKPIEEPVIEENLPENPTEEPIIEEKPSTEIVEEKIIPPVAKKRNPYKIAFFVLGSALILGTGSFFGYQYYKNNQTPVEENTCLDSETKIYDAYKDAVVLVKHQYGYFAKIDGKEIQLSVPEANPETLYGTGFFVDREGTIITNSHVAEPWNSGESNDKIQNNIRNFRLKIASILTTDISSDDYENFISSNWESAEIRDEYYDEGYESEGESEPQGEEFVTSDVAQDTIATPVDIAASIPQKNYVSEDNIEVYVKTIEISVALHNSNQEWLLCDVLKISENSDIDLASLQLQGKHTPDNISNIINLDNADQFDMNLKPGEKAVMIGFPMGEDFAQTNSGIKVQLYNGDLSKESDGTKIQYSITSTHGASGAPVFNNCGELIAVNFSGVDQVQGFNFGIVAKHIQSVYQMNVSAVDSTKSAQ